MQYCTPKLSVPALLMALCLFAGSAQASGVFIQVDSLSDSGPSTLRQAILDANAVNSADVTIRFGSTGTGTITLATPLPPLNNAFGFKITIDGYNATGASRNGSVSDWNGFVTVQLDCSALGSQSALTLASSGNRVYGLNFRKGDVAIEINGNNSEIEGCIIGCTTDLLTADGNAIGIKITSSGNKIGGTAVGQRNVISGNTDGLLITGPLATGNSIKNNWFGIGYFNATYSAVANVTGIRIDGGATNNIVGGPLAGERNIISGNSNDGVKIEGVGTSNNGVFGNYIGINVSGLDFGNTHGVTLVSGATNNFVGGITTGNGNVIVNNSAGVLISDAGTDGNFVEANYIGLSSDGTTVKSNIIGVLIQLGAQANVIGGDTLAARNVISGNISQGIYISDSGTDNNRVIGNYIGLDAPGIMPQGNGEGVVIDLDAKSNKIGGSTALVGGRSEANVISANSNAGVRISGVGTDGNFVQGNFIGLTTDGQSALGNSDGVVVEIGATGNNIGGPTADLGNVISGNNASGIYLSSCTGNVVSGNLIGLNKDGTAKVQNTFHGVELGSADSNIIGGTTPGEVNVISGNIHGVLISGLTATNNQVVGNLIGTTKNGSAPLSNTGDGVAVEAEAANNKIEKNLIAYNTGNGVRIGSNEESNPTAGNAILANSIHSNGGIGIDLVAGGDPPGVVTNNDVGDTDTSAGNNLQNFPVITLALVGNNGNLYVAGTIDSALPVSTLQFFISDDNASGYGQGKKFLLGTGAVAPGAFNASGSTQGVPVIAGDKITATATTTDGTSEFSLNFVATANTAPTANAGTNQLVSSGSLVTLDGSASADSDAKPNAAAIQDGKYFWSQTAGPTVALANPNSANPTFTPTLGGTYTFSLMVSDGLDTSAAASVTVQVNGRPVITGVTGSTPVRAGATITFTAVATDPEGDPLSFNWNFGDGGTAMTNPADHIFTNLADMTYSVVVVVSDGTGSTNAKFDVQVLAPNSGGAGTTNISTGKPPIENPLNGLSISVVAADGGVIEFQIDVEALNRAAFDVTTNFDGVIGRVGTRTGTRVVQKFTEPEIYVATTEAVDAVSREMKGKVRKTVAVGRKETGKTPKIKNRSVDTTVKKPKIKGNFLFGRGASGAATLPRPDKVTLSAEIELPEGLDISQDQEFSIGIGNIVDSILVDRKGKGITPSSLGRITKFKMRYPRLPKGTVETPAGLIAKFTMTITDTDLSIKGFDTEGVAPGALDLDNRNSAPRDIQVVLMMGGEPYEVTAPVNFKQNKAGDAGSIISGRGATQ